MRSRPSRRWIPNQSQPCVVFPTEPEPHSWSNHERPFTASLTPPVVHQPALARRVRLTYRLTASGSGPFREIPFGPFRTCGFSGERTSESSSPPSFAERTRRPPASSRRQSSFATDSLPVRA